jgi:hypothetical protein
MCVGFVLQSSLARRACVWVFILQSSLARRACVWVFVLQSSLARLRLSVLQFNTLGKHLAEAVQFPYAVDVAAERAQLPDRGCRYTSWDAYGIPDTHWIRPGLPADSTPASYLLGHPGASASASDSDSASPADGRGAAGGSVDGAEGTGGDSGSEHGEGGTLPLEESDAGGSLLLSWSQRFPLLVAQITRHSPDVVFLQVRSGAALEVPTTYICSTFVCR